MKNKSLFIYEEIGSKYVFRNKDWKIVYNNEYKKLFIIMKF